MKSKLIRAGLITGIILLAFVVYVEIANRNSRNMTYRQKVLKAVYPAWMWLSRLWGNKSNMMSEEKKPPVSFFGLKGTLNNGDTLDFASLQGKKVLLVNTASDCGFTGQYADLQKLFEMEKEQLVILAFPANDFKEQEKGSDAEIAEFCRANFGIGFPLMKKITVIPGVGQHPVYQWLTDPAKNGWNAEPPVWNFTKYLVNESGMLTHYFGPSVSPLDEQVTDAINK